MSAESSNTVLSTRRLPIGAELQPDGGAHFRLWAPRPKTIDVVVESKLTGKSVRQSLVREDGGEGYYNASVNTAGPGDLYYFLIDGGDYRYPDPVSRFQPQGVHGPSQIVDPNEFLWSDELWQGLKLRGQVLYELHFGTFTSEGTYTAAIEKLPLLKEVGITAIEVMPLAEYVGDYGWGYDGVFFFAPTHNHGTPDDFRRFVDAAHQLGMGVLMDVVYNHFGPDGNYSGIYSSHYVSSKHRTDWGEGINFDAEHNRPVREFILANAGYWIDEFHLDGLRLDAVQAIIDDSHEHILRSLSKHVRKTAGDRSMLIFAEDEWQRTRFFQPIEEGGFGLDGSWNDDFHHAARVAATGHAEYYYSEYQGSPQELISAVRHGYLYQGQWNHRQKKYRGSPTRGVPGERFVTFLQNHDQIANSATGKRLHELTSPGVHRALTALWLLSPGTPMFFQGQEFGTSCPFHYFVDHPVELANMVRDGRWESLRQFDRVAGREFVLGQQIDPTDRQTFEDCKLNWSERELHQTSVELHTDLLNLRRDDPVFASQNSSAIEGAVIGTTALLLRFFGESSGDDRLLLVNLGRDLLWHPVAEPLAAAPPETHWEILWSSDDPRYGGSGTAMLDTQRWTVPGHCTTVLKTNPGRGGDSTPTG